MKGNAEVLHPIHYSLIFNVLVLALMGFLSYHFGQPLLIVIALLVAQHEMARFQDQKREEEEEEARGMGFLADAM